MKTRYEAWMNGVSLSGIDESICITDIREKDPKQSIQTAATAWGRSRYIRTERISASVEIRFAIREYDPARRRQVCSLVREWAMNGYLSTSDRPGQRMYVTCEKTPVISSALKWTDDLSMQFTAYDRPWWEAETEHRRTLTNGEKTVFSTPGNSTGLCTADVTVTANGEVDEATVSTAHSEMHFVGLGMVSGDTLQILHDGKGFLSILVNGVSALGTRTAESSDDLFLTAGAVGDVSFTADGEATANISTRGRFD